MIEGKVEIGGAVLAVQDDQLMIYFPDSEGTSVPLSIEVVHQLQGISALALSQLKQRRKELAS